MSSSPQAVVAANLRALRSLRGMSVVTLATRSGVARATLTKIEAGQGNPTIDTLYALANALDAALGDLIGAPAAAVPVVEVVRAGAGPRVEGAVSARLLDRVYGHRLAEIYDATFSPKTRHADPHPVGVVESILVTAGRLRTGPVSAPVDLDAGDFVRFAGDVPHLYRALGSASAHGVIVMSHP